MATGLLIRVGIDSTYGWNAPCCEQSFRFCYVPIGENANLTEQYDPAYLPYQQVVEAFVPEDAPRSAHWPRRLPRQGHFDPDFRHLTYGDVKNKGKRICEVFEENGNDKKFIVFYAGLRSIQTGNLCYSIIGFYTVKSFKCGPDVPRRDWHRNHHTRNGGCEDKGTVIVFADKSESGRLCKHIPIGEYHNGAWRVIPKKLELWGGLCRKDGKPVKHGYIQRSAFLPRFCNGDRFLAWFYQQKPELVCGNNPNNV